MGGLRHLSDAASTVGIAGVTMDHAANVFFADELREISCFRARQFVPALSQFWGNPGQIERRVQLLFARECSRPTIRVLWAPALQRKPALRCALAERGHVSLASGRKADCIAPARGVCRT